MSHCFLICISLIINEVEHLFKYYRPFKNFCEVNDHFAYLSVELDHSFSY